MTPSDELFPGFAALRCDLGFVTMFARVGGSGPTLLLLHGYPQTHVAWHRVATTLAGRFTVVVPDLRGCGRSSYVPADSDHRAYSKRQMAVDAVELMRHLGFERFSAVGQGRGGRVAYRLALDHADAVSRLVVLDTLTSLDHWQPDDVDSRQRFPDWAFMAQPAPIPEALIGADPVAWLEGCLRRESLAKSLEAFHPVALKDYRDAWADPDQVHAACEDFRAGASCDLADDRHDLALGRRIICPSLVLWGTKGSLVDFPDPVAFWRRWCVSVRGRAIEAGHFVSEENSSALITEVLPFLEAEEA